MKFLLFHEISSVHTELKKGLINNGVDANSATHVDSPKPLFKVVIKIFYLALNIVKYRCCNANK